MNLTKKQMFGIGIIVVVVVVLMLLSGNKPEFFDIFNVIAFIFLILFGFYLIKKTKIPNWVGFALILIGIAGLIVDSYLVAQAFIFRG